MMILFAAFLLTLGVALRGLVLENRRLTRMAAEYEQKSREERDANHPAGDGYRSGRLIPEWVRGFPGEVME